MLINKVSNKNLCNGESIRGFTIFVFHLDLLQFQVENERKTNIEFQIKTSRRGGNRR